MTGADGTESGCMHEAVDAIRSANTTSHLIRRQLCTGKLSAESVSIAEPLLNTTYDDMLTKDIQASTLEYILASSLAGIRQRRNMACPINRLPPEILSMIFKHVPDSFFEQVENIWATPFHDPYDVLALSQVCRRWRDIALDMPTLWRSFDDDCHPNAQIAFLQRSRLLPIKLALRKTPGPMMRELLHSENTRLLELHWNELDIRDHQQLVDFPAPMLEIATVAGMPYATPQGLDLDSPSATIFGGYTPCLKGLTLRQLRWLPANDFLRLTRLHLSACVLPDPARCVLSLLTRCPHLEDLVLTELSGGGHVYSDPADLPVVPLPRLCRLVMQSMISFLVTQLLTHVQLGCDIAVRLAYIEHWTRELSAAVTRLPVMESVTRVCVRESSVLLAVTAVGPTAGVRIEEVARPTVRPERDVMQALPHILHTAHGGIRELWIHEGCCFLPRDCSPRGTRSMFDAAYALLSALPALDRVIAYGNMSSILSHILWNACTFSTYHILFGDHLIDAPLIHDELMEQQGPMGARLLVVAYLPSYQGERVDWSDLKNRFESVECMDLEDVPLMQLPALCAASEHMYWFWT